MVNNILSGVGVGNHSTGNLGEKGKVKLVVAVVFSLVDQLAKRSLGINKHPINNTTLI